MCRALWVLLLGLLCGCTTTELWKESNLKGPATDPNLRVYESSKPRDLLVVYNEASDRDGRIRRRGYYLNAFESRGSRIPKFVPPCKAEGLIPLPIYEAAVAHSPATNSGLSVLLETNRIEFAIWCDGRELGVYRLPEYRDPADGPRRFFLTPLALAVDVVIVALVLGLVFLLLSSSGDS